MFLECMDCKQQNTQFNQHRHKSKYISLSTQTMRKHQGKLEPGAYVLFFIFVTLQVDFPHNAQTMVASGSQGHVQSAVSQWEGALSYFSCFWETPQGITVSLAWKYERLQTIQPVERQAPIRVQCLKAGNVEALMAGIIEA